jgi:hypothetical protein
LVGTDVGSRLTVLIARDNQYRLCGMADPVHTVGQAIHMEWLGHLHTLRSTTSAVAGELYTPAKRIGKCG